MEAHDVKNFEEEVIDESYNIPVLVDFWAQWCGPCRILGPVLEKLSRQAGNKWILKKVNVEDHQDIASDYQVSGIPAVKLFKNGEPIAEFTGALPEVQIVNWLKNNLPSPNDDKVEQALLFVDNGNMAKARTLLEEVLGDEPQHTLAAFFLGKILLFENPGAAEDFFSMSEKNPQLLEESHYLKKLASLVRSKDNQKEFEDHQVKPIFMEAIHALAARDFDKALERFIEVIIKHKAYEDESARKASIAIFNYLGPGHELTKKYRRRFDMALY